jgi:fumarylacetoacetate (FAA) hydrolase
MNSSMAAPTCRTSSACAARGAEVPESFYTDPLMYQATSAGFYGPRDAVKVVSEDYGIDLEAEIVVITDDVPMAATPEQAAGHIQLVGLVNDVSLRNLIPGELAKGFGFLQSKPRSALSPVFVTPTSWALRGRTARCTCRC